MKRSLLIPLLVAAAGIHSGFGQAGGGGVLPYDLTQAVLDVRLAGSLFPFAPATNEVWVTGQGAEPGLQTFTAPFLNAEILRQQVAVQNASDGVTRYLVFYPLGAERNESTRRVLKHRLTIKVTNPSDATRIASEYGLQWFDNWVSSGGWAALEASNAFVCLAVAQQLQFDPRVEQVELLFGRKMAMQGYNLPGEPNDPFVNQQWHLDAINVRPVWSVNGFNRLGSGVGVSIIDTGIDMTPTIFSNDDLFLNNSNNHLDLIDGDTNTAPGPLGTGDAHGTAVGGIVAARGNNGFLGTGIAPEAVITAVRFIGVPVDDAEWVRGIRHGNVRVTNNSYGFGFPYIVIQDIVKQALRDTANSGRIHVFSAGNDFPDRADYEVTNTLPHTIPVGATTQAGFRAPFSETGSCVMCCAPGVGVSTTDIPDFGGYNTAPSPLGDFTNTFSGTSASAPMVSGVVALMMEANPNLTWRDVQDIIARNSVRAGLNPPNSFQANRAGLFHSYEFGFGQINAANCVAEALSNPLLPAEQSVSDTQNGGFIPDGIGGQFLTFDFSGAANLVCEHIGVRITVDHPTDNRYLNELNIVLTSPGGAIALQSILQTPNDFSPLAHPTTFEYLTVRHWGESSAGPWTLEVSDPNGDGSSPGTLVSATVTIFGSGGGGGGGPGPQGNRPPVITAVAVVPSARITTAGGPLTATPTASDPDGAQDLPLVFDYVWQESVNGVDFANIPSERTNTLPGSALRAERAYRVCVEAIDQRGAHSEVFYSPAIPGVIVDSAPVTTGTVGVPYIYDVGLFLPKPPDAEDKRVVINEFNQGITGNQEWVEFAVVQPNLDMRNWWIANGYALPDVQLRNVPFWSSLPAGTLVVVYNNEPKPPGHGSGNERDPTVPPDDYNAADGTLVVGIMDANLFDLPASGTGWGEVWDNWPSSIMIHDDTGSVADGLSVNGETRFPPNLGADSEAEWIGHFASRSSVAFMADEIELSDDNPDEHDDPVNWAINSATNVTPGQPNDNDNVNGNLHFINLLKMGAGAGQFSAIYEFVRPPTDGRLFNTTFFFPHMSIDPESGVMRGTPQLGAAGQSFPIQVRRRAPWGSFIQSYTLTINAMPPPLAGLDTDGDGAAMIFEEAFNLNPGLTESQWGPVAQSAFVEGGQRYLSMTFPRIKGGSFDSGAQEYTVPSPSGAGKTLRYRPEFSTDMKNWTSGPAVLARVSVVDDPADPAKMELVTFQTLSPVAADEPGFLRLMVRWE